MRRNLLPMRFRVFDFLLVSLLFLSACAHGPKVTVYISNPAKGGMDFDNETTGQKGFVPYSATDKFISLTPTDATALLNYCGAQTKSSTPQ